MRRAHSARSVRALASIALVSLLSFAPSARAESGQFNLHLEAGAGFGFTENALTNEIPIGPYGFASFDWQFLPPVALEIIAGGGTLIASSGDFAGSFHSGVGIRARLLDNQEGYQLDGGDWIGNLWVSGHLGFHYFDGPQFGIDAAVGYEFSVVRPLQIGVFARGILMIEGDFPGVEAIVVAGASFSFDLGGRVEAVDRDGDQLPDEREINATRTDPDDPDTDDDLLQDGIEVRTNTDPLNPDTDGDGAQDGREDVNRNGQPNGDEADPRVADTDGGGVPDGWELDHPPMNPRDPADDDGDNDRVLTDVDQCPDTAPGAEVDERGCVVIHERLVLQGIQFEYDSAEILPSSEQVLQLGMQALRDNPNVRVEVGGHTDNQGSRSYNQQLSQRRAQAVVDWMVAHGIEASRMRVRGYGPSRPVASNDTEEGRAQNRRIEFTVIE